MKKFVLALLLLPLASFAQNSRTLLSEKKIGPLDCSFEKIVEGETISYQVYCSYEYTEYEILKDRSAVSIISKDKLQALIENVGKALEQVDKKGESFSVSGSGYTLRKNPSIPNKIMLDAGGRATSLNKGQLEKWLEWLKSIDFPG